MEVFYWSCLQSASFSCLFFVSFSPLNKDVCFISYHEIV